MKSKTRRRPSLFAIRYLLFASLLLTACAPKPLLRPNGVTVAPDGSVYVMDRGNYRVVHFGAEGKVLDSFGKFGSGPSHIHTGWDMGRDSAGNLYICHFFFSPDGDLLHDEIKVFKPDGAFVRDIGRQDYDFNLDETVNKPYGLDIDAQDRLYVADFEANRLRIFDAQGQPLGAFFGEVGDGPGQFNGINDVAVDATRGLLYLSDNVNSRIQQFALTFDAAGTPHLAYQQSFGEYGDAPGQLAYPQGLAVDATSGRLYVADHANRRIQAFDPEGQPVASFAPPGVAVWQVLLLAVGPDGAVYATDGYNNAIWVFAPDGALRQQLEVTP